MTMSTEAGRAKFNLGDRVVVSNPDEIPQVEEWVGMTGTVRGWIAGHEPDLYRVDLGGLLNLAHFYENELTRIED